MFETISSKDNKIIKHISKVINSSKYRKKYEEFAIEGLRLCKDAVLSNVKIIALFYTEKAFSKYKEFIISTAKLCPKSFVVSEEIMKKLCTTETPQGIMCLCKQCSQLSDFDLIKKDNKILKIIILENIQDPSNLGTILRTAEALGVSEVILSDNCCDIYSSKVLRGSMGAIFRLSLFFSKSITETIKYLKSNNIKIYATVPSNSAAKINKIDFSNSCAVIMGNEGNGIQKETIKVCDEKVTIPMLGQAESLNVSIATGIIMWEMLRGGSVCG